MASTKAASVNIKLGCLKRALVNFGGPRCLNKHSLAYCMTHLGAKTWWRDGSCPRQLRLPRFATSPSTSFKMYDKTGREWFNDSHSSRFPRLCLPASNKIESKSRVKLVIKLATGRKWTGGGERDRDGKTNFPMSNQVSLASLSSTHLLTKQQIGNFV